MKVGFAAYYESVGRVDLMEKHKDEKPVFISGKDVRKTLLEGKTGRSADHAREHVADPGRGDVGDKVTVARCKRICHRAHREHRGNAEVRMQNDE